MKPKLGDPTINVGIKFSQKTKIWNRLKKGETINQFVQSAVDNKLNDIKIAKDTSK